MCLERRLSPILIAGLIALTPAARLYAAPLLRNASFETTGLPKYWELLTLQGSPVVSIDTEVKKVGPSAVRIEAEVKTLAVIQQKVDVVPNQPYILQGWIKTEELKLYDDADIYGTLLVIPLNEPDITKTVYGPKHKGTTDWTRIRLEFNGPSQGQVIITCSFCGRGTATGTVWFDGLELQPAAPTTTQPGPETRPETHEPTQPAARKRIPPVKVTGNLLTNQPINPMIYGNFIESGFGRQVDGMWSEMLFNRSFEVISPYKKPVWDWLDRKPEDDLTVEPWYHSGYEESRWYVVGGNRDTRLIYEPYWGFRHGAQAAKVANDFSTKLAWLAQDSVFLRKDVTYRLRGSMRIGGPESRRQDKFDVTVGLYQEKDLSKAIIEGIITGVTSKWKSFEVKLPSGTFEGRATFALSIPAATDLRVDDLSLQPTDSVHGWRRDVVEAMKRVRPRVIRFPGGCFASFYDWRNGIGPQSDRRPLESEFWGGLEYNDVGTAEFITLCREVDAEPLLCVNLMTGTSTNAADWVAYCNLSESHPLGALRKAHGHAAPFAIKYWELDNEPYRKYGVAEYAKRCTDFAQAMKKVDPSIKLALAVYGQFHDALQQLLTEAGPLIDLVTDRSGDEQRLRRELVMIGEYNANNNRDIKLCNTEWLAPEDQAPSIPDALDRDNNISGGTLQQRQIRWRYAMNAAWQLLVFQRLGGDFVLANFNNMANTWGQNVLECPKEGVYLSAAGRVFELFSRSPAAWPLIIQNDKKTNGLVVQAAWDADKNNLVLIVLNYDNATQEIPFDLTSLKLKADTVEISMLHAASPLAFNSLADPEAIKRTDSQHKLDLKAEFVLEAPPYSVVHAVLR